MTDPPPLYDVHLFAIIRRRLTNISASDPRTAVVAAQADPSVGRWLRQLDDTDGFGEFAEEFSHFLVDVVGDDEFLKSEWFHSDDDPLLVPLRELLAWDEAGRNSDRLTALLATVRSLLDSSV